MFCCCLSSSEASRDRPLERTTDDMTGSSFPRWFTDPHVLLTEKTSHMGIYIYIYIYTHTHTHTSAYYVNSRIDSLCRGPLNLITDGRTGGRKETEKKLDVVCRAANDVNNNKPCHTSKVSNVKEFNDPWLYDRRCWYSHYARANDFIVFVYTTARERL
jgi:hypothetical protein